LRAKVDCAACHGPIDKQTVAQRNVDLTMGVCVTCHTERQASNDCLTCHY
jgi:Cytochrome c7 and related cytochrome c